MSGSAALVSDSLVPTRLRLAKALHKTILNTHFIHPWGWCGPALAVRFELGPPKEVAYEGEYVKYRTGHPHHRRAGPVIPVIYFGRECQIRGPDRPDPAGHGGGKLVSYVGTARHQYLFD